VSRRIRNVRAARLQGRRAGAVSRLLAIAVDVGAAWVIFVVGFAAVGLVWDFLHTGDVRIASPGPWITTLITSVIFVLLLTFGWATTGRSIGKQVMGLRVVTDAGTILSVRSAFLRALIYLVFPLGGAWIVFSPRNASLPDHLIRSVVVHDWMPALVDLQGGPPSGQQRA
jgi:hypothetical protein